MEEVNARTKIQGDQASAPDDTKFSKPVSEKEQNIRDLFKNAENAFESPKILRQYNAIKEIDIELKGLYDQIKKVKSVWINFAKIILGVSLIGAPIAIGIHVWQSSVENEARTHIKLIKDLANEVETKRKIQELNAKLKELKNSDKIPINIKDSNGVVKEVFMSKDEVIELFNYHNTEINPKSIDHSIKKFLIKDLESYFKEQVDLETKLRAFVNVQDANLARIDFLQLCNERREKVYALIMEDNNKNNISELNSAINLHFDSSIVQDQAKFDVFINAMASGSNTATNSNEKDKAMLNIRNTQLLIIEKARQKQPINLELISEINKTLTEGTENNGAKPGAYRTLSVDVKCGKGACIAGMHVNEEMKKLCQWVNTELENCKGDKAKVIEIAARAYSWSESIHPFKDGNGRTCRAFANYILLLNDLPPAMVPPKKGPEEEDKAHVIVFGDQEDNIKQEAVLKYMVEGMIHLNGILSDYKEKANE